MKKEEEKRSPARRAAPAGRPMQSGASRRERARFVFDVLLVLVMMACFVRIWRLVPLWVTAIALLNGVMYLTRSRNR
ncbi:MAG: hypothetical protein ACYDH4_09615 [Candidatus Cryosericum sp.]